MPLVDNIIFLLQPYSGYILLELFGLLELYWQEKLASSQVVSSVCSLQLLGHLHEEVGLSENDSNSEESRAER